MKEWIKRNVSLIVFGLATAAFLIVAVLKDLVGIRLVSDLGTKLPGVLGSLLVVSLFVERVIEVFVSIWRDQEVDQLEQKLANWQDMLARRKQDIAELVKEAADPSTPPNRKQEINDRVLPEKRLILDEAEKGEDEAKKLLVPYYAYTRRVSMWAGMAVGVLAATVGFRFLFQVVDLAGGSLSEAQKGWFTFADVLLTGAILAGGSKAIHSIFAVYESFMDNTQKRANAAATVAAARSGSVK